MKNKNIIILALLFSHVLLAISCKNSNNNIQSEYLRTLQIPFDDKVLDYRNKDSMGYFIYDKSFTNSKYVKGLSRTFGQYNLNKDTKLLFIEKKPEGDEHIEPILILMSYHKKAKVDSLNIYETINWEGSYSKRFKIDSNFNISIFEHSESYDMDYNMQDSLIIFTDTLYYKINKQGQFEMNK